MNQSSAVSLWPWKENDRDELEEKKCDSQTDNTSIYCIYGIEKEAAEKTKWTHSNGVAPEGETTYARIKTRRRSNEQTDTTYMNESN